MSVKTSDCEGALCADYSTKVGVSDSSRRPLKNWHMSSAALADAVSAWKFGRGKESYEGGTKGGTR